VRLGSSLVVLSLLVIMLVGLRFLSPFGMASTLTAEVDIKPETLNVERQGRWIAVFIRLPEGFNVTDIVPSSILLENLFQAEWSDIQGDVLMVKFDASSVTDYLQVQLFHMGVPRTTTKLLVTGQLTTGAVFVGSDEIDVIFPRGSQN